METAHSDIFRDSLIGAAPLILGGLGVSLIARYYLGFETLAHVAASKNLSALLESFTMLVNYPDFWLWFYLVFTISSTMLPSASDRRAWLPLAAVVTVLLVISLLLGIGPWIRDNVFLGLNRLLRVLSVVFGISAVLHLVLILPISLLRFGISKVTKMQVQ